MAEMITVEALRQRLEKGEKVSILDVREGEDFAEWKIPGAMGCDAYEDLSQGKPGRVATFDLLPRGVPVVTVCYAGNTSRLAADFLKERGYDAVSLKGGMNAWSLAWNTAEVTLPGSATVVQVRRTGKGCLSYVVGDANEAVVIDPSVDPQVYLDIAREHGWTIKTVLETHVHADHLSRARALATAAQAMLYLPRTDRVRFAAHFLDDGAHVAFGKHKLVAIRAPGHTNESTCYHLDGKAAAQRGADAPAGASSALFTGDTLFLEGIGRPDLEADRQAATARAVALHGTLQKILAMPADTLILPAHVSSPVPFDGRPLVAEIRQLKARIPYLSLGRNEFVARLLEKLPPTPPNHKLIVKANESGELSGLDPSRVEAGANRCAVK